MSALLCGHFNARSRIQVGGFLLSFVAVAQGNQRRDGDARTGVYSARRVDGAGR